MVTKAIGDILPNDDELLAGITADFMNNMIEENEDDLFSSGGGLEMDGETQEGFGTYMSRLDGFYGVMNIHGPPSSGPGSVIGEHPYGEHPSRTLFVRNINSNVEDSELQILFEVLTFQSLTFYIIDSPFTVECEKYNADEFGDIAIWRHSYSLYGV